MEWCMVETLSLKSAFNLLSTDFNFCLWRRVTSLYSIFGAVCTFTMAYLTLLFSKINSTIFLSVLKETYLYTYLTLWVSFWQLLSLVWTVLCIFDEESQLMWNFQNSLPLYLKFVLQLWFSWRGERVKPFFLWRDQGGWGGGIEITNSKRSKLTRNINYS